MTAARNPNSAGNPQTRERALALGEAVRTRRKSLGLSQEAFAEKAGMDRQSISRLENAAFSPSLHRLWLLADALGVPLEELLSEASRLADGTDPQDSCKVGDPDPTGNVRYYCGAGHWTGEPGVGLAYACSREAGHGGLQHVATDGETVVAVWPR